MVDVAVNLGVPVALLCVAAGTDGKGEIGVLIADHGAGVVWSIVGSGADGLTG